MFQDELDLDVLVIGGGLAAMRAAVAAAGAAGASTGMMLKGILGRSGSSAIAGGGLAAVMGVADVPEDSVGQHYLDTLASGDYVNDTDLVKRLVLDAPQAIRDLEAMGAEFVRTAGGEIEVFLAPAHRHRRSVRVAGGGTARMIGPLAEHVRRQPIRLLENTTAIEILSDGDRAAGVVAVCRSRLLLIHASAVVLATGGAGRIYPLTSNMAESTGDGYAMAMRCGLALTGMEFVQFTPTALAYPLELAGLSTGGVLLGLPGTRLLNRAGERFMERYDPERKEASTRAILSRAIHNEVIEGRSSPHGGVFLNLTGNDPDTLLRLAAPFMKKLEPHGIDIRRKAIEIAPAVHYFMGGVEINALAETALPGLYCAGEAAGGVQGSNRLSSNSLSDVNVFGAIAGREAAAFARRHGASGARKRLAKAGEAALRRRCAVQATPARGQIKALHAKLNRIMFAAAGLVRDADSMAEGVAAIARLGRQAEKLAPVPVGDLRPYIELLNMLDTGEAVTRSALARAESRGAHFRSDFPERDDRRWRVATRVWLAGDAMHVGERSLGPQGCERA